MPLLHADGELADLAEMGTAGGVPLHQIVTMQWYRCHAAIHRAAVMVGCRYYVDATKAMQGPMSVTALSRSSDCGS